MSQSLMGTGPEIGKLYVVATPIGNLSDISERALDILRQVDGILAEDTRHSKKLLSRYGIATPCLAHHRFNESATQHRIIERLLSGQAFALISDAGTPTIQDPGALLVASAHDAGVPVVPVPGPCAAIAAVSASGWSGPFQFIGFLSAKAGERTQQLQSFARSPAALVIYESPRRLLDTAQAMLDSLGERGVLWARELTKLHEQVQRMTLSQLVDALSAGAVCNGESVLVVDGSAADLGSDGEAEARALALAVCLAEHLPKRLAAQLAAQHHGVRVNKLYKALLN